jgi:DNA-binding response OmpR family regulator
VTKILSRALVVHDDATQSNLALTALSRVALQTEILHSAKQAFAALLDKETDPPELVVLQVGLTPFSGIEIVHAMRERPVTAEVPVILLADSEEELTHIEKLNVPHCSCLVQPLTFGKLVFALPQLDLRIQDSLLTSKST